MKNHCKNNKTILLNKNPFGYFENNYQQFLFQKVMRDSKNTYVPVLGKAHLGSKPTAHNLKLNAKIVNDEMTKTKKPSRIQHDGFLYFFSYLRFRLWALRFKLNKTRGPVRS